MELKTAKLTDLKQYENNPRVIGEDAVEAVAHSITECGYIAPIIVDEDFIILAGHTRYLALKKIGMDEVQVSVISGLSEEQKKKYRLLDNKTNELSVWDFDALKEETSDLDFSFDFGIADTLQKGEVQRVEKEKSIKPKSHSKICTCPRCGKQWEE